MAASLKHVDPSLKGSEPGLYADDPPITHLVTNRVRNGYRVTWLICHTHNLESVASRGIDEVCTMNLEGRDCDCDLRIERKDGELDL